MAISSSAASGQASEHRIFVGFCAIAVLFNLCLVAQVLTVGLAYFYQAEWWRLHIWLVRGYSGLPLILTVWAYLNPLPQRIRSLTSSLLILLGLQFLTIHLKSPLPLGVVHPLIGFSLFSASTTLVHRSFHMAFPQSSLSISSEHEQDSEHA